MIFRISGKKDVHLAKKVDASSQFTRWEGGYFLIRG